MGSHSNNNASYIRLDEETPLLNGGLFAPSPRRKCRWWRDFLFSPQKTPGIRNANLAVRWLARVWHMIKVTLLSCKAPAPVNPLYSC